MSIPYEQTGRTQQKTRTRSALVAAARQLLAEGVTPTVERTADRAAISRTTAFRYFPNQRALVVATYPEIAEPSLLGAAAPSDPMERLEAVTEDITRQVVQHEPELRAQLRLSLEPRPSSPDGLPFRQGRAIGWLTDALSPLRESIPERDLRRLVLAIRATLGIEALVWLTDIAGLSREEAVDIMRLSARTLVRSAIADVGRTAGP
ncbi:MAG: TetR/AcrR family transcriptional regulator [Candidatus Dormibacteraeota bacterium]|nr:TetR/AcrR family transcriptional regulator [Candidatus Dormibacteraeota bacterium]